MHRGSGRLVRSQAGRVVKRFRIDVLVESDRTEESLGMFIEGVLKQHRWHFEVKDLTVYEVCHMPSYAEREEDLIRWLENRKQQS